MLHGGNTSYVSQIYDATNRLIKEGEKRLCAILCDKLN
jgi:hypothetical protein